MTLQVRRRSLSVLIALLVAAWLPSHAFAGASRKGNSFNASGVVGVGSKVTDVAYDPANDVYLFVSGSVAYNGGHVYGRFIQGDGTIFPALFKIPETGAFTQIPRVTYSAALGGFLVTWIDTRVNPALGQVWGRFVKFSAGGNPEFTTADFMVDAATGGTRPETGAAVACAGTKPECLVAWHQTGGGAEPGNDIHAARVNLGGQVIGAELFVTNDNNWQTQPGVSYDPANGVYLIVHSVYTSTGAIWAHRVQADTGAMLGSTVLAEGGQLYVPEPAFNSQTGQFLISWFQLETRTYFGKFIKSDGTVTSNTIPLLAGYGGYDANHISYSPTAGSFFSVTHGNGVEDVGFEVSGTGVPGDGFQVTATGGKGNFYPRLAAHSGRGEWLMTASSGFSFVAGQLVTTDTTGGNGGGGGGGGGGGDTEIIDLSQAGAPNGSWFLAEGVSQNTPNGFVTFYLIVNENSEAVNVRVYFSRDDGKTFSRTFTVAANARQTINLAEIGGVGTFGAVFQSLTPGLDIFVERSIYWGPNLEGSTAEVAKKSLALNWYFGEGSRDFFNNYFLLFNPNQVPGSATFTFFLENGTTVQRDVTFGPQQRVTMDAMSVPELANQNFGLKITSTVPVIAERAMYFGLGPNGFVGGTASVGSPGLNGTWLFAEGAAAPGFHTFYLLMNPNPFPIDVSRIFYLEDGSRLVGNVVVPAGSRKTIYLNDEMGHIGGAAARFGCDCGFIAERSIYWGAASWVEGTNVIGSPDVAHEWHVPEGTETGDFDSFLLILNPDNSPVTVDITVYIEGLGRFTPSPNLRPTIPAGTRLTINMKTFLTQLEQDGNFAPGTLSNTSFSTKVRALSGSGIVVEHALYRMLDGANRWRSGSASFGVPR